MASPENNIDGCTFLMRFHRRRNFLAIATFLVCMTFLSVARSKLSQNVAQKASRRGRRRCWKMMKMMKYSICSTYPWFAIPGALSDSGPQDLSLSGLSSQLWDLGLSERAWQKFLGVGGCPGETPRNFPGFFLGQCTHLLTPPNFGSLGSAYHK